MSSPLPVTPHAAPTAPRIAAPAVRRPWYTVLYIQVLVAIAAAIVLGAVAPDLAKAMKPLGDAFINLIKMLIAPVIFCTVVHGIGSIGDLKKVGRVGLKALFYFEVVSTFALAIGILVGELVRPGAGFGANPASLDPKAIASFVTRAKDDSVVSHFMAIIPNSYFDAFAKGDLLQVLLVAILTGVAITGFGERAAPIGRAIDTIGGIFFRIIGIVVKAAPIGAFGAMAFTVGQYGLKSLGNLAGLVGTFYLTSLLFVLIVLGAVARLSGFSILRFIAYIKDELLIVLGTSSSETVLPQMIHKMERLGASPSVVGLVIPTGYSFNLDGTNIYLTLAILFLAQAMGIDLSLSQLLTILLIGMVTSKGASGVTGAGFVTLAATLAVVPDIPVASIALILGIDKFMSECRALTNLVGNGVATIVVSRWEGELDRDALNRAMTHPVDVGTAVEAEPIEVAAPRAA